MENVIIQNEFNSSGSNSEEDSKWVNKDKTELLKQICFGTLIAFYDKNGKPRSGAVCENNPDKSIVTVVTEFGWEFNVEYKNVLWVKNGTRWPKGVYKLLKGKN